MIDVSIINLYTQNMREFPDESMSQLLLVNLIDVLSFVMMLLSQLKHYSHTYPPSLKGLQMVFVTTVFDCPIYRPNTYLTKE